MKLTGIKKTILVVLMLLGIHGLAVAQAQSSLRSCIVQEVSDAGGYSYIRCLDGNSEVWLGTPSVSITGGEQISYPDTPPMINFQSKSFNRTFPRISFVAGINRSGGLRVEASSTAASGTPMHNDASQVNNDSLYSGTDDNGTLVFTDDPSKAPKTAKVQRKVKKVQNATVLGNFSLADRKLVSMLEKALNAYCTFDMPGLKSITASYYWPELKGELEKQGRDKGAAFLHTFCFTDFRADTVKHFTDRSNLDGGTYPFADMKFVANRPAGKSDDGDEMTCTASFIQEKKGWKYIDTLCGGTWNRSSEDSMHR